MMRYVFVGERQSPKAAKYGHTWQNGHAAARTLHDTLSQLGISLESQVFLNLWSTPGLRAPQEPPSADSLHAVREALASGACIVALGSLVAAALVRASVPHRRMVHPAARGLIRKRERYIAHAREVLT